MKLLKKLLLLGLSFILCVGLGVFAAACGGEGGNDSSPSTSDSTGSGSSTNQAYVYRVSVQNETGYGFPGVTVVLKDGDKTVAVEQTNGSGHANFTKEKVAVGEYDIVVNNIPAGYNLPNRTYKTAETSGTSTTVVITPQGSLLEGEPDSGSYKLGDVMHDFSITLTNGTTYKLSDMLKEKKLVFINFWALRCDPCKKEFPYMHNATIAYEDTVSTLLLNNEDTATRAEDYIYEQSKYEKFNLAVDKNNPDVTRLFEMFRVSAIPQSIAIDRYGVIVFNEVGSMPSLAAFSTLFDKFVQDEYYPTIVGSSEDLNPDVSNPDAERVPPNVDAPDLDDLKDAFTTESAKGFTFRLQEKGIVEGDAEYDEYNWPWCIDVEKVQTTDPSTGETVSTTYEYIYASNRAVHYSYAILYSDVTVKAGDAIAFDYKIDTESGGDYFYVMLDGVPIKKYSGYHLDWTTDYVYVFKDFEAGEHEISFVFIKDTDGSTDDIVRLKELRIVSADDLSVPEVSANVYREAATVKTTEENATTQYENYVEVVYNPNDEYYHVGSANGPLLYANMMTSSLWSEYSVWQLAYNDYVVGNGMNFHYAMEEFAWEATQLTEVEGYTPVTQDLKYLLDATARYANAYKRWQGAYHDKEWLEMCVYWEHYGDSPLPEDPMRGVSFTSAIPLQEGDNEVNVRYKINPRGFKYKFIPTRSGAYKISSTGDLDTLAFLFANDRKTMLGTWDDKLLQYETEDGTFVDDYNFEFYWYMEAGKTYYFLFDIDGDGTGKYNVNIEYIASTHQVLSNGATQPYSANLNTFELFLPNAISYVYADPTQTYTYVYHDKASETRLGDGYYHYLTADGNLGSVIYLDTHRPTPFQMNLSLSDMVQYAEENQPDETKRELWIDGEDYTDDFSDLCYQAENNTGELYGFVAVDKEVFDLINKITLSQKYDGIKDSWLLLCYYYQYYKPGDC